MAGEVFDELNKARANRAGAWILLFVGLFGAGFGLWHARYTIVDSFALKPSTYKTLDQIEEDRLNGLKSKDTDGDGISDYDETYVFHTSPYLKDSDGDGIDDKTELARNTNPNCPEGKQCGPLGEGAVSLTDGSANATGSTSSTDVQQQALDAMLNPTPAQVRQFLLDSGAKQSDIDQFDDATLLQMYHEALKEAQQTNNAAPAPAP